MNQRYFRASPAVYEQLRSELNAAWGMPRTGTESCFMPASNPAVPADAQGRRYLAVHAEWCEWEPAASLLPSLLDAGAVEEVAREAYMAALPQLPESP